MFGKLSFSAFPHDPITAGAAVSMIILLPIVIGCLTYFKRWKWFGKNG